jgi:hypothetical protein
VAWVALMVLVDLALLPLQAQKQKAVGFTTHGLI